MPKKKKNIPFQYLIKQLGTSSGTALSIIAILSAGFGAGVYYQNLQKNLEILEIQKNNFIEVKSFTTELEKLRIEKKRLILKIADYEQKKSE
ncbi:hypothetical protein U1E44_16560 [Arenibacter sp. GZD96]|uniref:hypothetical protein n=1 Tax=Aurantibrevibacter litoralis TaxID=3106030 RepID=UPI002AFED539|nr:hypothetical protein [Arenibacter sp. GZD-96]MEA1787716.1 hypothetical protein [Arenibacter sp. GZD-96]